MPPQLTAERPDLGIEWDAENRLIAVKQGGSALAGFTYTGSGRRSTKVAGGITTTYVYDGAEFLEERPSAGSSKRYIYGAGIDQPLAQVVSGATTYNVADHLGSIVRTTDSFGTPTLTRQYDPWGNPIQGSTTSGYAFTGREWDAESGLYYYRARYYDPTAGRFISEDPSGPTKIIDLYGYALRNPLQLSDPLGLKPGDKKKERDAAVMDTYHWMKDQNYALAYEFGGRVCQDDKDKCFFCTGPVTDPSDSVVKTMKAPCPAGSKDVGMYHTHPWYSPLMNGTDVAGIGPGKASYLWVVSKKGPVLKYEPPDPYQRTIDFIPVPTAHE